MRINVCSCTAATWRGGVTAKTPDSMSLLASRKLLSIQLTFSRTPLLLILPRILGHSGLGLFDMTGRFSWRLQPQRQSTLDRFQRPSLPHSDLRGRSHSPLFPLDRLHRDDFFLWLILCVIRPGSLFPGRSSDGFHIAADRFHGRARGLGLWSLFGRFAYVKDVARKRDIRRSRVSRVEGVRGLVCDGTE